jgi:hypothetical protein
MSRYRRQWAPRADAAGIAAATRVKPHTRSESRWYTTGRQGVSTMAGRTA